MSEMHAETAAWIDALRRRADRCESGLCDLSEDHKDRVDVTDRLGRLRRGLDHACRDSAGAHGRRSELETMADEIDRALARGRARI